MNTLFEARKTISAIALKALNLIQSNPRHLTPYGDDILNRGIRELLKVGAVDYAPDKNTGYRLTKTGQDLINVARGMP